MESNKEHLIASPLLTPEVMRFQPGKAFNSSLTQYGLIGNVLPAEDCPSNAGVRPRHGMPQQVSSDSRLFYNTVSPSSAFICGSQGSGKSHTLCCLLENCLTKSDASVLPKPWASLVFHYDTFISDDGGSPCEAAYLASMKGVSVRVLCSPTNVATIKVNGFPRGSVLLR